jgi:Fic family protein
MCTKLSVTNPYLRDPTVRERTVFRSVASSSAIEGIHAPFRQLSRSPAKDGKPPKTGKAGRKP